MPDLAVSGFNGISILQGPDLSSTLLTYPTSPLSSLVLGDFNGDGRPDLAGADRSSNTIVLLNAGTGLSPVETPSFCGEGCQVWFASADFDGSGTDDLVVSTRVPASVNVLLSTYNSSKQVLTWNISPVMLPPDVVIDGITYSFFPSLVATGRFTQSGHTDLLAVVDLGYFDADLGFLSSGMYLLLYEGDGNGHLGDGRGGTGPAVTIALPIADNSLPQGSIQSITSIAVGDVNGDGNSDVVLGEGDSVDQCGLSPSSEWFRVLLGDGKGGFTLNTNPLAQFTQGSCGDPSVILSDFNNDRALDIFTTSEGSGQASLLLNGGGGSWQTPLTIDTQESLFPVAADFNQDGYIDVAVGNSNGTSILYNSGSAQATLTQVILPAGTNQVTASFAGDIDYSASSSSPVAISVAQALPTLVWTPAATVPYGTVLGSAQLNATANVPGTFMYSPPAGTVLAATTPPYKQTLTVTFTPTDTKNYLSGSASVVITVTSTPVSPVVTFQGPPSGTSAEQPTLSFSAQPYPLDAVVSFTLTFASSISISIDDPNIQFASGGRTYSQSIPANSIVNISLPLQTGTVAGTITVSARITAGVVDVTPSSLTPVVIVINPSVPNINSVVLTRSGSDFQVAIMGYSNTREVTQAEFHFQPAPGRTLKTTDLTMPGEQLFSTWYQNGASDQFGSAFLYTQPFTTSGDSTDIATVTVTLTNSQGTSNPAPSQ